MANSLIFFTPRTGSSILADLLAFKYAAWNLDEILSHQVRPQIINKLPTSVIDRIKGGRFNARERYKGKSSDSFYQLMCGEVLRSINFVKQLSNENDIVIKCYTYPAALPRRVIELAIDNNFEIYFLHRSNIEEQMYSIAAAVLKEKHNKTTPWSAHVHTNKTQLPNTPPQVYSKKQMHTMAYQIGIAIHTWNTLQKVYGHYGVTACYEDTIAKNDFSFAKISDSIIDQYKLQSEYLVPTKDKVENFILNWEELKPIINSYIIYK